MLLHAASPGLTVFCQSQPWQLGQDVQKINWPYPGLALLEPVLMMLVKPQGQILLEVVLVRPLELLLTQTSLEVVPVSPTELLLVQTPPEVVLVRLSLGLFLAL